MKFYARVESGPGTDHSDSGGDIDSEFQNPDLDYNI